MAASSPVYGKLSIQSNSAYLVDCTPDILDILVIPLCPYRALLAEYVPGTILPGWRFA